MIIPNRDDAPRAPFEERTLGSATNFMSGGGRRKRFYEGNEIALRLERKDLEFEEKVSVRVKISGGTKSQLATRRSD